MQNVRRIAFSGTHGTGKTTDVFQLARDIKIGRARPEVAGLVSKEPNLVTLLEVARECPFSINKEGSLTSQMWIFSTQLKKELEAARSYDTIIQDRPIFDSIAYTMWFDKEVGKAMLDMILKSNELRYDLIIYKTIRRDYLKDDGLRENCYQFQQEIQNLLLEIYNEAATSPAVSKIVYE